MSTVGHINSQVLQCEAGSVGQQKEYVDCGPNNNTLPDTTQGHGIPSNTNWLGDYHFEISFQEQTEKMTKSTSWTYSEQMDKLFVNMGVSCIVCFRVQKLPPPGCIIRALPIFEKCDHIRNVVKRCPTHCLLTDPSNQGHSAPEHLVRCDSEHADYITDSSDGRQSVIIPFLPPQAGTDSTQYLYKFMCLGSCVGGLNRRPLQLIFTLENNGQVLGRRTLKVRICACPGRDRKSEENAILEGPTKKTKTLAKTTANEVLVFEPSSKRQKFDDELFTLTIQGRANYEVLMKVKESLELASMVPDEILEVYRNDQKEINRPSSKSTGTSCLPIDHASTSAHCTNEQVVTQSLSSCLDQDSEISASVRRPHFRRNSSFRNEITGASSRPLGSSVRMIKREPVELIKSWLQSINMEGYVDMFVEKGLRYMCQLEKLNKDDIDRLPIGDAHRLQIWKALLDFKGMPSCLPSSQGSQSDSSQGNVVHSTHCKIKRVSSIKKIKQED